MDEILNITNGDCAVDIMKKADINGDFLPWRDVLHDGPVPKTKSLELLIQKLEQNLLVIVVGEKKK